MAYAPLLAVRPGVVTPDTKTYLYLDPTRFLSQAAFMWNPTVGLGTVNHQYIGYLLPMGPFFAVFHLLGVPVWVAQRLWLGSILFAAGLGVLYLSRILGLRGPGPAAAALAYMLSPYFLQYSGRISVILLPWAGLPFMLGLTIVALRRSGWREPALFAVVVATVSGINASSILYVGMAPILWLFYAVVVLRESTWRHALATGLRISILTLGACLWWMAGLQVEAAYGVNVLKFTETVPSTSATSNPADIIRGLGYWYFYGTDHLGPWTNAAIRFTQDISQLATSYAVPVAALVAAAFVRWRERAYFLILLFVGLVLSVGPFPFSNPTVIGGELKSFMTNTTAGLALRSTDRATPLVLLALVLLLGSGLTALWSRVSVVGLTASILVAGLVVANMPSLFLGDTIANNFTQPATLPSYQVAAIDHLNATHPGTRVLAIPGNDFAAYRWGDTVDTPQPALLTPRLRHTGAADHGIDRHGRHALRDGRAAAGRHRQPERTGPHGAADGRRGPHGRVRPAVRALRGATAAAPGPPAAPGTARTDRSRRVRHAQAQHLRGLDAERAGPLGSGQPRLAVSDRDLQRDRTRARCCGVNPTQEPCVMEGDATGLNNLAGLGLLNTTSAIYYAGTLAGQPARLRDLSSQGAQLVLTDTNRKQAFRWDTLTANAGYTETPGENPAKTDLSDSPMELFPGTTISSKSYAAYVGAVNVTASSYGNSVSYTPEDQAYSAIDDNFDTAWITGTFVPNPAGQWWQAQFANPVTTDHITLVQPQRGDRSRWVSAVTVSFDGKDPVRYDLTSTSHVTSGQTLTFPTRTFHTLRVTIDGTTNDTAPPLTASAVGFAEIEIPGQQVHQVVQMPTQMLSALGASSAANRLTVVMTRQRTSQFPPRTDPETTISRQFTLPTPRTFTLSGSASLSALVPDDEIDRLVGRTPTAATGVQDAYSSGRLPGSLGATASATVDGDATTAWQPGLGSNAQVGSTLTYDLTKPQALSGLAMQVIADGRHSVPTAITITSGSQVRKVTLPAIADGTVPGAVTTVPVSFPALTGSHFIITFTAVRPEYAANYYSAGPLALPLGIAEIGFPDVRSAPTPANLPGTCVSNLLAIDGRPIDVAVVGSAQRALQNGEVQLVPCGPDAKGITLGAGPHVVQTAPGTTRPARAPRPPARAGTSTRSPSTRRRAAAADPPSSPRRPGPRSWRRPSRGRPRPSTATSSHIDTPRRRRDGGHAILRARARPEPQQGLAGGGPAGARRRPGLAGSGPRDAPAGRRLRQRMARQRRGPAPARRSRVHRRADLDPPTRGLGRAGGLRRHVAPVPGPRLPPPTRPAPGTGLAAPPAAGAGGARRAGAARRAVRRPRPDHALLAAPEGPAPPRLAALPAGAAHRRGHRRGGRTRGPAAGRSRGGRASSRSGSWSPGPVPSRPWAQWPSSWPAASTSSRGRTCTTTCRAPTGPARSSMPAT